MLKRKLLAVAASLGPLLSSFTAPVVSAAADPLTCVGYPEPRVFLEIQAWWQERNGPFPGEHIHVGTCWPTGIVSSSVTIDMRIITHAQPAGSYFKRLRMTDGSGASIFSQTTGFNALDSNGDMTQWISKTFNVSGMSSGLHEMRLAGYVQRPGTEQFVSSGLPLFVKSMSGGATSRDYVEARGWYPGFLYTNVRYGKGLRLSDFLTPKSGIWKPTFQCATPSGASSAVGTRFVVSGDPLFHSGNHGTTYLDYLGEAIKVVTIDTTKLSNGLHRIVPRCEASNNLSGNNGINSGVLSINYTVQN